jgi:hypothetical protein
MRSSGNGAKVPPKEVFAMQALWIVVVFAFVAVVLAVVAFALFEITPFARHTERFRDPRTGKKLGTGPRLD